MNKRNRKPRRHSFDKKKLIPFILSVAVIIGMIMGLVTGVLETIGTGEWFLGIALTILFIIGGGILGFGTVAICYVFYICISTIIAFFSGAK